LKDRHNVLDIRLEDLQQDARASFHDGRGYPTPSFGPPVTGHAQRCQEGAGEFKPSRSI